MSSENGIWQICGLSGQCYMDWLYDWQTMLAGGVAVAAAYFSIRAVRDQIQQAADLETDRRVRAFAAARARMPAALNSLCDYAESIGRFLRASEPISIPSQQIWNQIEALIPEVPAAAVDELVALIETTDNADFGDMIAKFIAKIQIMASRLVEARKTLSEATDQAYFDKLVLAAGEIYGFCSTCFPFARREVHEVPTQIWPHTIAAGMAMIGFEPYPYNGPHNLLQQHYMNAPAA